MTAPPDSDSDPRRPWIPIPDPTTLTTSQLKNEIAWLVEVLECRFRCVEGRITRNDERIAAIPDRINEEIIHATTTINVRIAAEVRLKDTEVRDSREAMGLAIQASERASSKYESGIAKQIDQLQATFSAEIKAFSGQISDVKDRINILEGSKTGVLQVIGVLASIGAMVGVAIAIIKP